MDTTAAALSLKLAALTALVLLPLAMWLARWLATSGSRIRPLVEAALLLPLLLPPTVIGFYLLTGLGGASPLGAWLARHAGVRLVFSFEGLLFASVLVNLPFMVQPLQRAFAAIPGSVREAAWVSGLSGWRTFWRIDLPLAWPGVLAGVALTFAHTLGEFGVVLMVGGNIAGETRTLSIAIYDRVQAFDNAAAAQMSLLLVAMSLLALGLVFALNRRNPLQER
jgi:molybdate transport system permease protein